MLSKAQIKHIQSLARQKFRTQHQQFVVEGKKTVEEAVAADWQIDSIYCSKTYASKNTIPKNGVIVEDFLFEKISFQSTPSGILAVLAIKPAQLFSYENSVTIALEHIQDPGNLGTIIRIADWYGIANILCSPDTVDAFNPKTIQASMGSFLRVNLLYAPLEKELENVRVSKIATTMQGESLQEQEKITEGIILIGNEANGLSEAILSKCDKAVRIDGRGQAESLNAPVACGIICSHLLA